MLAFIFRHHAPRALTLCALVISAIALLPASASANTIQNYACTNGLQSSTVPANASTATITLKGAQGGQNAQEKYNAAHFGISANIGGPGDAVQISLPVTPGSSFAVNVGCIDGYNGGGLGGTDGYYGYFNGGIGGGSGGGATDITPSGGSFSQAYGVAGGGGGAGDIAGGLAPAGTGGNGGNSSNDSGGAGGASGPTAHGGLGGQGGYYGAAGGVGGSGANFTGANGASGSGNSGGLGGNGSYWGVAGGAGGGGWVGGGGGGGGGQGSTYTDSGSGGGGGGGSSYVAFGVSSTFLGAGNSGDGSVTINYNTPTLAVSPSSDDYGDVTVGQSPTRDFTVSNSGGNTLTLGTVSLGGTNSGQFAITQDNCSGQSLTGAGTCTVQVAFAPNTKGSDSATLSLPSNSDSGSPTTVPLSGVAQNPPTVSVESSQDFGTVTTGQNQTKTIALTNSGDETLNVGQLSVSGQNVADFSIVSGQDNCSNQSAAPQATCTVELAFAPTSDGAKSASLAVPSNDPNSPANVALTGQGANPATVSVEGSQDFGTVTTGQNQTKTITLTNSGDETLNVGQLILAGVNPDQIGIVSRQDNCSNQSVAPQARCTVEMAFAPTSDGAKSASLTISSNDPNSPANVALTGTGQAPASPPPSPPGPTRTPSPTPAPAPSPSPRPAVKSLTVTHVALSRHLLIECRPVGGDADDRVACRRQSVRFSFALNRAAKVHVRFQLLTRSGWRTVRGLALNRRAGHVVVVLGQGWFEPGSYRLVLYASSGTTRSPTVSERLRVLAPRRAPETG